MALTKEELQELWSLLVKRPDELTDKEIERLLAAGDELEDFINCVWTRFPEALEKVKRDRARIRESSECSTDEDLRRKTKQTVW